jgi:hypothetical protein
LGVLGLDGDSDDGGNGVLHGSDVVGIRVIGDGSGLDEVLIDSDQSDGVSTRNIGNIFDGSSHHDNGSLDGLFIKVVLLSWFVVGSHDSDLLSGLDSSGEHSSEGEESRLIGGGHHFGNVHHKGSFGVAILHGHAEGIIFGSFIKIFSSVFLGNFGGRKVQHHHFNNNVSSIQPSGHNDLLKKLFRDNQTSL